MSGTEANFRIVRQIDILCVTTYYIYEYPFFQGLDSLYWLNENAAMIEHIIELQFRMDDVEDNNRDKGQHAHSDKNGHKEGEKQQNDYPK